MALAPIRALAQLEFTVALDSPFSLDYTLNCGQAFRWRKRGDWWHGVASGAPLKLRQEGETLKCSSEAPWVDTEFVWAYFRMEERLEPVLASFTNDEPARAAVERFYGLRVARQDKWECLASFLLATNANIPRIQKMISSVCDRFGEKVGFEGETYSSFPTPTSLAEAKVPELRACGLGYRAPFLRHVAKAVATGRFDLDILPDLSYEEARDTLLTKLLGEKTLLGVGPKVADCFLLYSCDKTEAFPVDVWIARVLSTTYPRLLGREIRKRISRGDSLKLSRSDYFSISKAARRYFGPNAGYAQLYLYMAARAEKETF